MREVSSILQRLEQGDLQAGEELVPLVYKELRRLAEQLLTGERAGHTLTPTALVHEAYIRLVGASPGDDTFASHAHFFSAAAQAMRRVLIDSARRKKAQKRGGNQIVLCLEEGLIGDERTAPDIEALDDVLKTLEQQHPDLHELVSLRYFAGMTMAQAAQVLGVSLRTAERNWHFARAWLKSQLSN